MRLSKILEHSLQVCPSSPCVIFQKDHETALAPIPFCLTYQAAYHISLRHKHLIQQKLCEIVSRIGENTTKPKEIVAAFLAHNSADLLLAVLAITDIDAGVEVDVLPVLLNTRWTYQEIAQALQSQQNLSSSSSSSSSTECTLFIHDNHDDHANRVQQAATILQQQPNHQVATMRLSSFSLSYETKLFSLQSGDTILQSNVNQTPTMRLPSQSCDSTDGNQNSVDETAVVLFTSGTTSGSKGVLLSHRALYIQALAKIGPPCCYDGHTKMLATTIPLFHVGGLSSAVAVLLAGGSLIFPPINATGITRAPPSAGFQPDKVVQSLCQDLQCSSNTLVVVPAMLSLLFGNLQNINKNSKESFPLVRLVLIGGQSASLALLEKVFERFPNARVVQTYACTEGASSLTFWERRTEELFPPTASLLDNAVSLDVEKNQQPSHKATMMGDCVGIPPPHVELCLFPTNEHDGKANVTAPPIVEPFTPGVMATRGPHLLTGYWSRGIASSTHDNSKNYLLTLHDGWFVTNDLGYRDSEGRYYFCGRIADVIRTGGETVLATEVEQVLLQHHDIAECTVFALPDDARFGETVCAAVVWTKTNHNQNHNIHQQESITMTNTHHNATINIPGLSLTELRTWCAQQGLAGYKRPRRLFSVAELPRNSSGKVLKRVLVERFRCQSGNDSKTPSLLCLQSKL